MIMKESVIRLIQARQTVWFVQTAVSLKIRTLFLYFFRRNSPQWAMACSFTRFPDHTQRRITVGRTPLDE